MPLTLASLVQHSALKLTVLAGESRLDTPVRWAHVSELADPVPYLEGGELLLITALKLDVEDEEAMRRYVGRLDAAGVVGLGFAAGVSHEKVPRALLDAARETDFPLLEVPRRTPFLAISKAVSAAVAADQYQAGTEGCEAQRELTRAAQSAEGPAALLARLAVHVDGWAALYDISGELVAVAPAWAARRAARLTGEGREGGPACGHGVLHQMTYSGVVGPAVSRTRLRISAKTSERSWLKRGSSLVASWSRSGGRSMSTTVVMRLGDFDITATRSLR